MQKKGYYFSVEALLAILILATSFFMVGYFTESAVPLPDYRYAQNIAGYLSHVTLGELCAYGCGGIELGKIGLDNYSLMDVIGYKYSQSPANATNITEEIFAKGELLMRGKEVAIIMRGITCDVLYTTGNVSCQEGTNETREVVLRKVIQGYVIDEEKGKLDFWGDYVLEVRVW